MKTLIIRPLLESDYGQVFQLIKELSTSPGEQNIVKFNEKGYTFNNFSDTFHGLNDLLCIYVNMYIDFYNVPQTSFLPTQKRTHRPISQELSQLIKLTKLSACCCTTRNTPRGKVKVLEFRSILSSLQNVIADAV